MLGPRHGDEAHSATTMAEAMSGMDMDGHGTEGGMMMMSVFQTALDTPLYSTKWTPNSPGTYAATCIFLIVLAVMLRGMLALKSIQESRWLDAELKRRYVVVNGRQPMQERLSQDSLGKNMVLSENGVEENVTVVQKKRMIVRPWRFTVDPIRAVIDTVIAGVGYLL
jgi:hypothetical protein